MTDPDGNANDGDNAFELSLQQERLWELGPDGPAATVSASAPIPAGATPEAVRDALAAVVARHEALRTTFRRQAGLVLPLQVIADDIEVAWDDRPFDLAAGPVLRAAVADGALTLSAPAVVSDRASLLVVLDEIASVVRAEPLGDEPLQYADYAAWQRGLLDAGDALAEAAAEHWATVRADAPATGLPLFERIDHSTAVRAIDIEGAAALRTLADRLGISTDEVWLVAWVALTARLTALDLVVVEVSVDGRTQPDLRRAVGPYALGVPVRVELPEGVTFDALAPLVASARAASVRHQDRCAPGAGALVAFGEAPAGEPDPAAARLVPDGERAHLVVGAGADVTQAERIGRHLTRLLASAAADGDAAVARLDVWDPADRDAVVVGFNAAAGEPTADPALATDLIERQAALTPDRVAVRTGDDVLTYAQLDARANQIAHVLRSKGVGRDTAVGVLLDRSTDLVVALLGVLKAGAAYLPLHLDHPPARVSYQLTDAAAPVLLTKRSHERFAERYEGEVLCLDRDAAIFAAAPESAPERANEAADLVYLIYTSGSTGVPKGVEVSHGGLAAYTAFMIDKLELGGDALHVGLVTSVSTDLGNTALFPALMTGCCLHVLPTEVAMDPALYAAYVAQHPIDVLKITPSHLAALLTADEPGALPSRALVIGGEPAPWSLVDRVRELGTCTVLNHYGPTETTVGSTTFDTARAEPLHRASPTVPIGTPIRGTVAYVVDPAGVPAPVGTPGELWIGGAGVARGYVGQPEQTAERFLVDPFRSNGRIYRTGDLARFLPDGVIEFLGRVDTQIKIRGYRVEVAEIEEVLRAHPRVDQVAVVSRPDVNGGDRLVAYVVGRDGSAASPDEVRAFLRQRIPEYMVPHAYVSLGALPMTANGKLDRNALPEPGEAEAHARYRAAQTATEQALAAIWIDVLGLERIGIDDDFFELGGHSLLATRVTARVRNTLGVNLPLHTLFNNSTVAALAAVVDAELGDEDETDDAELAAMLAEIDSLSDEEARGLLGD